MLDQLIESNSRGRENNKRGGFMLTTSVLVIGFVFSALLWSLFAKDVGAAGNEISEISTLVAPIAEDAPPAPVQKQEKPEQSDKQKSAVASRQTNMAQIDESQYVPNKTSITPNTQKARPNGFFLVRDGVETDSQNSSSNRRDIGSDGTGISQGDGEPTPIKNNELEKPPPPPPVRNTTAEIAPKTKPTIKTGGVVNGQAKFLPKPVYTAAAKAVKASGDVNVQVLIDEAGNVVSASAVSGHPLLKGESERAARNAKFKPTLLSDQPVKVTGIIVYKFSMQ